jgi:hypothetical protein
MSPTALAAATVKPLLESSEPPAEGRSTSSISRSSRRECVKGEPMKLAQTNWHRDGVKGVTEPVFAFLQASQSRVACVIVFRPGTTEVKEVL